MFKTIKSKFIVFAILFIVISVGIPMHFLVRQFKHNFEQRSQLLLGSTLDMLMFGLDNFMMMGLNKNVQSIVDEIGQSNNVDHIRIISKDGRILFSSKREDINKKISEISPNHIFNPNKIPAKRNLVINENLKTYMAIEPIFNKKKCQRCHTGDKIIAYLDVDTHMTKAETNFFTGSLHLLFLGFAILIVLVLGLIFIFSKFINQPIHELISAFENVEKGDLSTKIKVRFNDEFGTLSNSFNRMVNTIKINREKIDELHFEQLLRADKLATIGEMTAQTAHEINNYTGIIFSRVDYLTMEINRHEELKPFSEDLETIQNQIEKVSRITKNILLHAKKTKKKKEKVNLNEAIDLSLKIFEPIMKKRNISVVKNILSDKAEVTGNSSELEQMIVNIVYNSLDAISDNGRIIISLFYDTDNKLTLKIEDTGIGMNSETIKNIFSPFFTTKENEKGTGLGLYIVKRICDEHNATISCKSAEQEGTTFTIKFN